jgi:hypothetical protein
VTFSDLSLSPAGGRLGVYCHTCDEHIEHEDDLVSECEWDAAFITLVMDHCAFTPPERDAVSFAAALGDMDAALSMMAETQNRRCPNRPGSCSHR